MMSIGKLAFGTKMVMGTGEIPNVIAYSVVRSWKPERLLLIEYK